MTVSARRQKVAMARSVQMFLIVVCLLSNRKRPTTEWSTRTEIATSLPVRSRRNSRPFGYFGRGDQSERLACTPHGEALCHAVCHDTCTNGPPSFIGPAH